VHACYTNAKKKHFIKSIYELLRDSMDRTFYAKRKERKLTSSR